MAVTVASVRARRPSLHRPSPTPAAPAGRGGRRRAARDPADRVPRDPRDRDRRRLAGPRVPGPDGAGGGQYARLALLVGAGSVAIGLPLGWLTARTDLPFRRAFAVLVVVPLAVPSYVLAFAVIGMFGPSGTLATLLAPFGVETLPEIYGLPGAVFVLTLATYPYVTLAVRAAVVRLDPALLDAARSLGDDDRRAFRRVVLPILVPAVTGGALLAVLYALADFGSVSLLQFDTLSRAIYVQYRATFDRSLAAVLALSSRSSRSASRSWRCGFARVDRPRVARSRARPMPIIELGRWRWPSVAVLRRGDRAGPRPAGGDARRVARPGVSQTTSHCAWCRAPPGTPRGRRRIGGGGRARARGAGRAPRRPLAGPGRVAVEAGSMTTYALPGIVVALAVVFFASQVVPFAVPDARAPRARLCGSVPAAGAGADARGLSVDQRRASRSPRGSSDGGRSRRSGSVTLPLLRPRPRGRRRASSS